MIRKFKKLPVVIEACKFDGNFAEIASFVGEDSSRDGNDLLIHTTNGWVTVNFGEWIIKGVDEKFYSCPDDVFFRTYEMTT